MVCLHHLVHLVAQVSLHLPLLLLFFNPLSLEHLHFLRIHTVNFPVNVCLLVSLVIHVEGEILLMINFLVWLNW